MFDAVAAWMTAAKVEVQAAVPTAFVIIGPLVTQEDIGGLPVVAIGSDVTTDSLTAFEYDGGWHDTGVLAITSGEVKVPVSLVVSAQVDDMPTMLTAANDLHAAVHAALVPSPAASALGVSGLMWAQETGVTGSFEPLQVGSRVVLVCTYTLATLI